ncbi:unnamed protein product [Toxocara canis]|uniref:Dynactin domain-containing protein n=1 Tax=Toxocara canis TaxID=6265 RepID=A0A183UI60_TOXCA|nr:unnamed protein product [Toxocara canis]
MIDSEDLRAILEAQEERQHQVLKAVLETAKQQQQALLEQVGRIFSAIGPTASPASAAEFVTNSLSTRLPEFIYDPDNGDADIRTLAPRKMEDNPQTTLKQLSFEIQQFLNIRRDAKLLGSPPSLFQPEVNAADGLPSVLVLVQFSTIHLLCSLYVFIKASILRPDSTYQQLGGVTTSRRDQKTRGFQDCVIDPESCEFGCNLESSKIFKLEISFPAAPV